MALLTSGASSDKLTVDTTSMAGRATLYRADGTEYSPTTRLPITSISQLGTATGVYACSTPGIAGTAAATHVLATIANPVKSGVGVHITQLLVTSDTTAAGVTLVNVVLRNGLHLPSGGSPVRAVAFNSASTIARATVLAAVPADLAVATPISVALDVPCSVNQLPRFATAIGYTNELLTPDNDTVALSYSSTLSPGECLCVIAPATAATRVFTVNISWLEYT